MAIAVVSQEETLHWLALRLVPGLGMLGARRLLDNLKTPMAIFRASASELEGAGATPAIARNIASGCSFEDAVDQQQKLMNAGAELITFKTPVIRNACAKYSIRRSCCSLGAAGTAEPRMPSPWLVRVGRRPMAWLPPSGSAPTLRKRV